MPQTELPLVRLLKASSRSRLEQPFRASASLRARHFPGGGGDIPKARLLDAYVRNYASPEKDWQLLAHGTWSWIEGHAADLAIILGELRLLPVSGATSLDDGTRSLCRQRFTEEGAAEIDVFVEIYAGAGRSYQESVIARLEKEPPAPRENLPAPPPSISPPAGVPRAGFRPESARDLDPQVRTRLALMGSTFVFLLSLVPLAIQYWRQPDESHPIVLGLSGLLLLLTVGTAVDFLLKRRRP